ncbi:MAG: ribosome maturation factor RimP [Betaproteobacteria bacterium]|nr:ribosome maturation factor RimP [Betaproteobacteria bacterium]MDE2124782.1 ribosome maturation factor RimP [Betaproteobacteria bacterium]MDE2185791.1 ribosome maturation factor RimP [Betaproteobacteria bacterium]MDE2326158.1 ribosome maturation factor RimP [Betaproteobacteria bacterium]
MQNTEIIETTVRGMGYACVEIAWASAGLLRITIDRLDSEFVTVDDCERVTRQLQYALEVEGLDYRRLEVSSPGLDRLVKLPDDWERFAGLEVEVTLRAPYKGRKKYRGMLQAPSAAATVGSAEAPAQADGYVIVWDEALLAAAAAAKQGGKKLKAAQATAKKAKSAGAVGVVSVANDATEGVHELRFSMAEAREVRLVPVLDFRGRKS